MGDLFVLFSAFKIGNCSHYYMPKYNCGIQVKKYIKRRQQILFPVWTLPVPDCWSDQPPTEIMSGRASRYRLLQATGLPGRQQQPNTAHSPTKHSFLKFNYLNLIIYTVACMKYNFNLIQENTVLFYKKYLLFRQPCTTG